MANFFSKNCYFFLSYLVMYKIVTHISFYILYIFISSFFLVSCITPKHGTISDYRVNPVTGEKTCKVYVNVKYNETANGVFYIEGDVILTKKGDGQVKIQIPDKSMHLNYIGGGTLPTNLQNWFNVNTQAAQQIAKTITDCHENRHKYDHVQNQALALLGTGIDSTFDARRPEANIILERNATGAASMMLAKILRSGDGDLSQGWEKMKNNNFNYDYFEKNIYERSREKNLLEGVDFYEQVAVDFLKRYYKGILITGTTSTYEQALALFENGEYADFNGFKTYFKNIVNETFEKCETGIIKSTRQKQTGIFGRRIVSHTINMQNKQSQLSKIGSSFLNGLLNNNRNNINTSRPAASGNNYCWSCRVQDPGMSRCIQPSCPNYGNPPSMAR